MPATTKSKKGIGCFKIALIIIALIIFTPILLLAGFFYFGSAQLRRSDAEVLKTYQPIPEITDIADKNALTDKGKATFYRSNPTFVDAQAYIKYCQTLARGIESLACNAPKPGGGPFGGRQIFLLKIDDPKFEDHKYSASIHEMLHSAYQRLGSDEKKRLGPLLDQELSKRQDDPHLVTIIETLKEKKGDKSIREELHSKFGVEYKNLSPELEEYYKQYFVDRNKVVELFQKGGFNSKVRKMDQLKQELGPLNAQLTNISSQLTTYKNAGDIDQYNNLVPQFNNMISQYNAKVAETNRIYKEIEKFYQYFNPDYQPPQERR